MNKIFLPEALPTISPQALKMLKKKWEDLEEHQLYEDALELESSLVFFSLNSHSQDFKINFSYLDVYKFWDAKPFPHIVIQNIANTNVFDRISSFNPKKRSDTIEYNASFEQGKSCFSLDQVSKDVKEVVDFLGDNSSAPFWLNYWE